MAKSRSWRDRSIPTAVVSPRPGRAARAENVADWLGRAEPAAANLESFLAKGPASLKVQAPAEQKFPFSAPTPAQVPSALGREAHRNALEAVRLMKQGHTAQAIASLQQSVKLNPGVASSHHDLGVALMAAGRLQEAAEAFSAALRLNARLASAHHFLAYIFDCFGQEEKAMAGYRAAVALRPDLAAAQTQLGELYQIRRQNAEAAAAYRAVAAATTGTVTARIAEARAFDVSGASDDALVAMRAIVEANPENAEAHSILAKLLGQAGLSSEAAAHYERVTELAPDLGVAAWSGVATNRKFTADDGPLIARMSAALARPHLTPRIRQGLLFALGKAHDDMGNYEEAMRNFEAGNRLRALGGGLNRETLARRVNEIIEATPLGYRDRQGDSGVEDATPILIVGMPRSGSTLTEQILSSHPDVAAGGELEFWGLRDAPRKDAWSIASTPEATRRLANDYVATLRRFGPEAKRITDKALKNFMLLGIIHHVFPKATLIHCRRHPVDAALSIFTTNFETNIDYASDRGDLVFFFRQYERLMAHWRQILPSDRFVEVDYEALVADPEPHSRRLVAACGLEWNDSCLAPHRNTRTINTASLWQARQPIYRSSVERWRRYAPWLGELRQLDPQA